MGKETEILFMSRSHGASCCFSGPFWANLCTTFIIIAWIFGKKIMILANYICMTYHMVSLTLIKERVWCPKIESLVPKWHVLGEPQPSEQDCLLSLLASSLLALASPHNSLYYYTVLGNILICILQDSYH